MKVITLIPIKNEDWILEYTLKSVCQFSDHVIVADQQSTDKSLDICKKFPKVKVINNENLGHSNKVRWSLLDEAREIDGNNLIFCIDADEIISPSCLNKLNNLINSGKLKPGSGLSFSWIQIWGSVKRHRVDGVWRNNIKAAAFYDDRKVDYKREYVVNDHTSRIPDVSEIIYIEDCPLLHVQSISVDGYLLKQAWYRCFELMQSGEAKKINYKYSVASINGLITEDSDERWFDGVDVVKFVYKIQEDWRYKKIISWFDERGVEFFEPLDIWHIKELHDIFFNRTGREPKIKKFPRIIIELNRIKNRVKNFIK